MRNRAHGAGSPGPLQRLQLRAEPVNVLLVVVEVRRDAQLTVAGRDVYAAAMEFARESGSISGLEARGDDGRIEVRLFVVDQAGAGRRSAERV